MQIRKHRTPGLVESLIPVLFLIGILIVVVRVYGDAVSGGPNQVALMLSAVVATLFALSQGCSWQKLQDAILHNIHAAMQAMLILLLIGALIGTWILGGVVPTLVVWGLKLLSPSIFLFTACAICALVSMATGSSWSTAGTVGLALIGVGHTMGISMGLAAGAVISGAYFGDKMSPLSDTTNLAPAMAGTDLFTHVKHMVFTTGPSMIITLVIFFVLGFTMDSSAFDPERINSVISTIESKFDTSLVMLLPMVLVIGMVVKKVPALPAVFLGAVAGTVFAVIFQPAVVVEFAGGDLDYLTAAFKASVTAMASGYVSTTGTAVDTLLSRGGMASILPTLWLIMSAMMFGGVMQGSGMLYRIAEAIVGLAKKTGHLIATTIGTATFMNLTASDQYLSIVITGRMYKEAYEKAGLHPKNLSRALEDAGTLTSPLVPWNTCGQFMSSTLGVATLTYLPYCFLNLINPFVSILLGYTGWTIAKIDPPAAASKEEEIPETKLHAAS
jgi:NhaC family Na+:H+ antiporter